MLAVMAKAKREDLFLQVTKILRQWPENERKVFIQSHYNGRSLEAISRSFKLDTKDIITILRLCDRRLHTSLKKFRKNGCNKPEFIPAAIADLTGCR